MKSTDKTWYRYLPITEEAQRWGLHVLNAGYTLIPANSKYPPYAHPEDHDFTWEQGRRLSTYTIVYITRGSGTLETELGGLWNISAGDLFILFPGEWHRYQPNEESGWDEHWVEFDGEQANRIMTSPCFSPQRPVMTIGIDETLLQLFLQIDERIDQGANGFEHIIAAQTSLIVANIMAIATQPAQQNNEQQQKVRQACCTIVENGAKPINFIELAKSLGMSASGFRKMFRKATGLPPGQYQQQVVMNRARDLLRLTNLSVTEISNRLGFESVYYFSRIFKQKHNCSPLAYRKANPSS